jgi:hypothetical protein
MHHRAALRRVPRLGALAALAIALAAGACVGEPSVTGHACIVFDLRIPDECAAMQIVGDLSIVDAASHRRATTDGAGQFDLALPGNATTSVLEIAGDSSDRRTSLVRVPDVPATDVLTPVITTTLWSTYLAALGIPDDPSRATIHVSFKRPGEYVATAQIAGATQILFNQGAPFDWKPVPPGDQTVDFIGFGVPADASTARVTITARDDSVIYNGDVPVQAGAITWLHVGP